MSGIKMENFTMRKYKEGDESQLLGMYNKFLDEDSVNSF